MLSRPFLVLFGAVFLANMGISMVSPILPVYAEELGAAGIWIGLTFSIFAVSQTLVSPFAGGWSDRYGRKPFIILGLLIYLVAAIGYLTADSFLQVLIFRAFSGCGTSLIFAVGQAYLGDIVPRGREGRWLGVFALADIVGFGAGPILSGALRDLLGFDSVFVGMAVMMGSGAVLIQTLLPADTQETRHVSALADRAIPSMIAALRHRTVVAVVLFMSLTSLTYGSLYAFLAVFLDDRGVSGTAIGIALGAQAVTGVVTQPLFGRLADRVDRRYLLLGGLAGSAIALGAVGAAPSYPVVLALLFVLGIASSAAWVSASAVQVVAGRQGGMGTVIGLGAAGDGTGILLGGVVGGLFAGWFGVTAAFYFAGAAMGIGVVVLAWLLAGLTRADVNDVPDLEVAVTDEVGEAGAAPVDVTAR